LRIKMIIKYTYLIKIKQCSEVEIKVYTEILEQLNNWNNWNIT